MPEKRSYTPWEIMMITEWVARTFPDASFATNVRLGPIITRNDSGQFTKDELRLLGVYRRRIDGLVYLADRLVIVEAILKSNPGKLSILELYSLLVPRTPELEAYKEFPVQKVLLYCIEDPVVNELARRKDIVPIQYIPTFFNEWFNKLRYRDRRAPQSSFL